MILEKPGSFASIVTYFSLFPVARSRSPLLVFKNASMANLHSSISTKLTSSTRTEYPPISLGIRLAGKLSKMDFFPKKEAMESPSVPWKSNTRLTDSSMVYTRIPQSRGLIFSFTCKMPVTHPAAAPAKKEITRQSQGLTPFRINTPLTTAPNGMVPSTDKSGKSRML